MKYTAVYEIDGGISRRFGLKEPCKSRLKKEFNADSNSHAVWNSVIYAINFSKGCSPNPDTERTKVKILDLKNHKGKSVDQTKIKIPQKYSNRISLEKERLVITHYSIEPFLDFIK